MGKIDIKASTNSYEGYYGDMINALGDIAIDDFYVYNTSCSEALQCPAGAYQYTNPSNNVTTCYTIHPTPMTWPDAFEVCRREGPKSALVSINTKEEQDYLVNLVKSNAGLRAVGQNGFYTSGNDLTTEHNFYWGDRGNLLRMSYENWHQGQPNNVGGNQNCLLMEYPDDEFSWGDVDCDTTHPFICEATYD